MQPLAEKERRRTSSLVQAIERVDGLAAVPCDRGIDRHEHRAQTAGRKAYLIAVDGHGSASGASASRREKHPPCYSHCDRHGTSSSTLWSVQLLTTRATHGTRCALAMQPL